MNLTKQLKNIGMAATVGSLSLLSSTALNAAVLTFEGGDATYDSTTSASDVVVLNLVATGLDASTISMGIGIRFNSNVLSLSSMTFDPFWNFLPVYTSSTADTVEITGNYLDLSFGIAPDFANTVSQGIADITFNIEGVGSADLEFYWLADGRGEWGYTPTVLPDITTSEVPAQAYCLTIDDVNCLQTVNLSTPSNLHLVLEANAITVVPVPAAAWLFGSGLIGLVAVSRRKV